MWISSFYISCFHGVRAEAVQFISECVTTLTFAEADAKFDVVAVVIVFPVSVICDWQLIATIWRLLIWKTLIIVVVDVSYKHFPSGETKTNQKSVYYIKTEVTVSRKN